jgi:hypothetical protein
VIHYRLLALGYALDAERRGVKETRTNWSDEIGQWLKAAGIHVPAPWCAAFVYSMVAAAYRLAGLPTPLLDIALKAYVQSYVDNARRDGETVPASYVHPGDLVCFDFKLDGHYDHIGIVLSPPDASGNFTAVEGNTNDEGSREGYEVAVKTRNVRKTGAIFINYDTGLMYEGNIPEAVRDCLTERGLLA